MMCTKLEWTLLMVIFVLVIAGTHTWMSLIACTAR